MDLHYLVQFLELLLHQIHKENLLPLILDYMLHLRHLRRIVLDYYQCLLLYLLRLGLRGRPFLKQTLQLHLGLLHQMLRNFLNLLHRHYFLVVLQHTLLLEECFQNLQFLGVLHLLLIPHF
jgi:hypothetical protein